MQLSRLFQLLCLVISLMSHFACSQPNTHSQKLASLYDQGNVRLNVWLSHVSSGIAVHEQVTLNIEVMTDTWFTKGTKVHRIEVDNAVVLPMSSFAVNSTERIDGKVYSKQLWEIVLYPLHSGEYQIPPVALEIGVKQGSNNVVGVVMTKALFFNQYANGKNARRRSISTNHDLTVLLSKNIGSELKPQESRCAHQPRRFWHWLFQPRPVALAPVRPDQD